MRSKRGLGVLAVCGLVLGLMAISASSALALVAEGDWMVAGNTVKTTLKIEAKVEIEPLGIKKEVHLVLLTKSGANKVAILCGAVTNVVGTVTEKTLEGTLNINKCVTFINEKEETSCNPLNQPVAAGGTAIIQLHPAGSGKYAVLQGKTEKEVLVFTTLKFECTSLPETVKITGELWIEDCNGEFDVEKSTHLIQEAMVPALALGGLKFGTNAAEIHGSVNISLVDAAHAGNTFSGLVL